MAALHRFPLLLLVMFLAVLAWSGWQPRGRFIWVLEAAPAVGAELLLSPLHDRQLRPHRVSGIHGYATR